MNHSFILETLTVVRGLRIRVYKGKETSEQAWVALCVFPPDSEKWRLYWINFPKS